MKVVGACWSKAAALEVSVILPEAVKIAARSSLEPTTKQRLSSLSLGLQIAQSRYSIGSKVGAICAYAWSPQGMATLSGSQSLRRLQDACVGCQKVHIALAVAESLSVRVRVHA